MSPGGTFPLVLSTHTIPPGLEVDLGLSQVLDDFLVQIIIVGRDNSGQFLKTVSAFKQTLDLISFLRQNLPYYFSFHSFLISKGSK